MPYPSQPAPTGSAGVMAEDTPSDVAPAPASGDQAQTAELPVAMFGQQPIKPGDVFEFKVVSVDEGSGTVTVAYNQPDSGDDGGGSDDMAAEFNNNPKAQT